MARLQVVAIAARLPAWAETACSEYARRMPKGYEVERIALKDESRLRTALPKSVRLVIGNPLIMKEIAKRVPDAGSYAPVTILVDERSDGVHLSYVKMTSLMVALIGCGVWSML